MPLRDHFQPPIFPTSKWEPFHSMWANKIATEMEVWPYSVRIGTELPTLPFAPAPDLSIPVNLESIYSTAYQALRYPT